MNIIELKTENQIIEYVKALEERRQPAIALDVEAEFNLHYYGEHLCLVQIYDQQDQLIIDPLRFRSKNILKCLFEKRNLLKIMYDSGGDASLLLNEYGIRILSVLDLRPAVILLEYKEQRLSDILQEELGLPSGNKKKYQTYNWMRRPIDAKALAYAMNDVRHLFDLKDILLRKIIKRGLVEQYLLQNLMCQNNVLVTDKAGRYKRAKGFGSLSKLQQQTFRKLFDARDAWAQKLNRPPHYVYSNADLVMLCRGAKRDAEEIRKGLPSKLDEAVKSEILAALTKIMDGDG